MLNVFTVARNQGAAGIILWGSSNDLKTEQKCNMFRNYLDSTIGPIANSFRNKILVKQVISPNDNNN